MKQLEQRVTRLPLGSREPDPLDELDSILERVAEGRRAVLEASVGEAEGLCRGGL